ncbi:unnamed protein product [Blepharisma stoltei]|uniref:Uncharacterized protein n=1 Tax=Blepharisma stoltei TaxID=1481888 RepID=A0AAU9JQI9_9CILI|nr:unnamed protein product [Blepharisma stoltei]
MEDSFNKQVKLMIDATKCHEEFQAYDNCMSKSKKKSEVKKCKELYKVYQFCITKREDDRLHVSDDWAKFKAKWGHLPNEPSPEVPNKKE